MDNLDIITQNLEDTIKKTIETLSIESIAKIIIRFRERQILDGDLVSIKMQVHDSKSHLSNQSFFNNACEAEIYHKKTHIIIDVKQELKDLLFFAVRFDKCMFPLNINTQEQPYSEEKLIKLLAHSLYKYQAKKPAEAIEKIYQQITTLEATKEKEQIESIIVNTNTTNKMKL